LALGAVSGFDPNNLDFLHQDEKASGEGSTLFKLVRRDS